MLIPSNLRWLVIPIVVSTLIGCGGSSTDVVKTPAPPPTDGQQVNYQGPPAATDDVQRYKLNLWDNIVSGDRCGACHTDGEQSPQFARDDDINLAYSATNPLVNLTSAKDSLLVTKVAGGHNCWLSSPQACGDIMTTWIANWANTESKANEIELEAPIIKEPGQNKNFPQDGQLFSSTVHPLLETYCAECHTSSATIPIAPYFASSDIEEAYGASKVRINLDDPMTSRFATRLKDEFHNCWSNCNEDAAEMIQAIQQMSDGIELTQLDSQVVNSKALTLFDGTLASGGGRFEQDVIAKWEFKSGQGVVAFDTSGVEPALDLTLSGNVNWLGGWGLQMLGGKAQGSTTASKKIHDLVTATSEMSIEAWVVPANVTQEGPARIITYSGGANNRNFTLGQTLYNYNAMLRTSNTSANGEPALSTADADEILQASLQHVVTTYSPVDGRKVFVNGEPTEDVDQTEAGVLSDWNDTYAFALGSEVSGDFSWLGSLRFVAMHNRVLTNEQIKQNFDVGIGQLFYLLFDVSEQVEIPQSYIAVEVSQFDNFSYLFAEPFFISLNAEPTIDDIPIKGIRIGVNGREVSVGQVFQNLDLQLTQALYVEGQGQTLSPLGTIVGLEKGPELDEFFLTFEQLGDAQNVYVEAQPPQVSTPPDLEKQAEIGMRNFAEINATMAFATEVAMSNTAVSDTFNALQQQLPTVTELTSFLAANQMAVTQLAIKYCDQLVEDPQLRSEYFAGFDFSLPATTAFESQDRQLILTPLINQMLGNDLTTQPNSAAVETELNNLIDTLSNCSGGKVCDSNYTRTIVKASCSAVLGSAALLVQ